MQNTMKVLIHIFLAKESFDFQRIQIIRCVVLEVERYEVEDVQSIRNIGYYL